MYHETTLISPATSALLLALRHSRKPKKKKTAPAIFKRMYTHNRPKFLHTSSYEIPTALRNTFELPNEQKPQDCVSPGF